MADLDMNAAKGINVNSPLAPSSSGGASDPASNFWGSDGLSFDDFIDLINPLQHIPIIGNIYRAFTGDQISTGASVLGGALFGGIIGIGAAVVNAIIEEVSGSKISENILAMFNGEESVFEDADPTSITVASATGLREQSDDGAQDRVFLWPEALSQEPVIASATTPAVTAEADSPMVPDLSALTITKFPAPELTVQPAVVAMASPAAQNAVKAAQQPATPAWLSVIPHSNDASGSTIAVRAMTPEIWQQLVQTITANREPQDINGSNEITRDVVNLYSRQTMAANGVSTAPTVLDILN